MTRVLSIDPGMSTGLVLAEHDDLTPYKILGQWQLADGGTPQLRKWMEGDGSPLMVDQVVCEKFSPLPRVFKLRELEALRTEGYIEHGYCATYDIPIKWQRSTMLNIAGDKHGSYAANHKAANDLLRKLGLWALPKSVGCKDANDANAAMKHLIAYYRSIGHQPSLEVINSV